MPYVTKEERSCSFYSIDSMETPTTPGQLNYYITTVLDYWLNEQGTNYANLNAAIGVLECAKLELYRRVAAPYEDKKLIANGDVYQCLEAK